MEEQTTPKENVPEQNVPEQNKPEETGSIFNEPEPKKKSHKLLATLTIIFITLLGIGGATGVWYWQEQQKSAQKAVDDARVADLERQKEETDKQLANLKEKYSTTDETKTDSKKLMDSVSKASFTAKNTTGTAGWKTYSHSSTPVISLQYPANLSMHRSQSGEIKKVTFNNNLFLTFEPTTETSIDNYLKIEHGNQVPIEGDTFDKVTIGKGITAAVYDPYDGLPLGGDIFTELAFIKKGYLFTLGYHVFPDDGKNKTYQKVISTLTVK